MTLSFMSCSSDNSENKSVAVGTGEEVVVATSVAVTEILDALGVKVSGFQVHLMNCLKVLRELLKLEIQ